MRVFRSRTRIGTFIRSHERRSRTRSTSGRILRSGSFGMNLPTDNVQNVFPSSTRLSDPIYLVMTQRAFRRFYFPSSLSFSLPPLSLIQQCRCKATKLIYVGLSWLERPPQYIGRQHLRRRLELFGLRLQLVDIPITPHKPPIEEFGFCACHPEEEVGRQFDCGRVSGLVLAFQRTKSQPRQY